MNRVCFLLIIIFHFSNVVYGQIITGTVSFDNYTEPAVGAAVVFKGTTIGTFTDAYGNYKIDADSTHKTLCFSYIGFETVEIDIENRILIDVSLKNAPLTLDDFIVTSFRKTKKRPALGHTNGQVDSIHEIQNYSETHFTRTEKSWLETTEYSNWSKFIFDNINYPDSAFKNNVNGNVYAQFVIDTVGRIRELEIIKGIDKALDQEVYKTLLLMPKWTKQELKNYSPIKGKKYSGIYILPVKFKIKEEQF
ncbi:MAG: carboxypeptidase-like regulatory domain-containing protein [Bacteroidales bacterium]|nr:carboxypeptidase-like regulatory domain-containing protein [Bacteroidales bacterium]